MYKASDVARYIIKHTNESRGKIGCNNLKLQKLLYLIQGYFLIAKDCPCFSDNIEAWGFGPVIPEVYKDFSSYGGKAITSTDYVNGKWKKSRTQFNSNVIARNDAVLIEDIVNRYAGNTATELTKLTLRHKPYRSVCEEGKYNIITVESIQDYFLTEGMVAFKIF